MKHAAPGVIREKHDGALGPSSSVRVWLRMLSCTMAIEKEVQRRFATMKMTLPRFDILAALDREGEMLMGDLSRALLVSNGNITPLVRALGAEGLVEVRHPPEDRRRSLVALTDAGRVAFSAAARAHHGWIDSILGGLNFTQRERLYVALGILKMSISNAAARRRQ